MARKSAPRTGTEQLVRFKAEFFKALTNPIRIRILDELRQGEVSAGDLSIRLGVEPTNLSQQLAVLRTKNLVNSRKQGSNVYYSIRDPAIFKLLDVAKQVFNNQLVDVKDMLDSL